VYLPVASDLRAQHPGSRAFVRPSGTEDCVRLYAEAPTPEVANRLQEVIESAIREELIDKGTSPKFVRGDSAGPS
jgi:phosphomannomutase